MKSNLKKNDFKIVVLLIIILAIDGCLTINPNIRVEPGGFREIGFDGEAKNTIDTTGGIQIYPYSYILNETALNPSFSFGRVMNYNEKTGIGNDYMITAGALSIFYSRGVFYYNENIGMGLKLGPCILSEYFHTIPYSQPMACILMFDTDAGIIGEIDIWGLSFWIAGVYGYLNEIGFYDLRSSMFEFNYDLFFNSYRESRVIMGASVTLDTDINDALSFYFSKEIRNIHSEVPYWFPYLEKQDVLAFGLSFIIDAP